MTENPDKVSDYIEQTQQTQDTVAAERTIHRLQARLRDSEATRKQLLEDIATVEARHEFIEAIRDEVKVAKLAPRTRKQNEAAAVLVASDWHWEEVVDPATVNGRNAYNLGVARKRATRFFQNSLRLIEQQRAGATIKTAVLALLGDMITGYIHEELVESNELSPTEAVLDIKGALIEGIDFLLEHGGLEKLVIPCTPGNHGRTTPRRRISTGAANSYEWLLYHVLAERYARDDRVKFVIADGSHLYVDVLGVMVRFHHGDDVRYQGGVGGLSIPLRKACDAWDDFIKADLTVIGHWHQLADFGFAVVNASLIGFNAYALSVKARYEDPQQAFFLIDKQRRRKTVVAPIFVEDPSDGRQA